MPRHTLGWRPGRSLPDHALRFQKRIESKPAALVPKFVATLELNDDKVRIAGNIFRKMYITVAAAKCACRDGGGFGRPIRKSEVEGLVGQENGASKLRDAGA